MASGPDPQDVSTIEQAYEDTLKDKFYTLVETLGDEEIGEAEAQQHFANGVEICKRAKKLALDTLMK